MSSESTAAQLTEALTHLSLTLRGCDDTRLRQRLLAQADEYLDLLELARHDRVMG